MTVKDADPTGPQVRTEPVHDFDPRQGAPESRFADYLDYLQGGFQAGPVLTGGAAGPAFLTWGQQDFREMRRKYGEGDPDVGSYHLNQVHYNKENGTLSVQALDVGPSSWYGSPAGSYDPVKDRRMA